ncbi:hypothetical protein B0H10DRAFT_1938152 [Mycena sp. CBHHK59/15]|nr:hypothetical protein B0H10DRAFT_1938152 [Mycena sp. CBHHK59/15]
MSISQLLQFDLPPRSDGVEPMDLDNNSEFFSTREPTTNIEDLLLFLALPTRSMLQGMVNTFGQAWFDGNKSLQTWLNPEIPFPFWVLTYWGKMLDACKAHDKWVHAAVWLRKRDRTAEELAMRHTVEGLWSVLGWHGNLRGFGSIEVLCLADFFSEEYLGSGIVDALLSLLSFCLTLVGESITGSNDTLIMDTTFAQFLELLLLVVDAPIREHKDIWKKYGSWFQDAGHWYLYLVLYCPPDHWTTSLTRWVHVQTDGFNCPIISVNTIGHNALGDPLWTPQSAKTMRMKVFCDIVKHALSAKNGAVSKPRIADPTDWAENLLAVNPDFNDDIVAKAGEAISPDCKAKQIKKPVARGAEVTQMTLPSHGVKRAAEDDDQPRRKIAKTRIKAAQMPGIAPQPSPNSAMEHLYMDEDDVTPSELDATEETAAEEVQRMVDNLVSTVGSMATNEQLDACVMASVALSMDELAKMRVNATQPTAFIALLQGMAQYTSVNPSESAVDTPINPPSSKPLIDVLADDLAQLVALRQEHQTREEKMGVRTYKSSGTYKNFKTGVTKELSERQQLAQQMHAIIHNDEKRGSSTGLNRTVRWTKDSDTSATSKTGNAGNAVAAAGTRAKEVIKRRRAIFGKVKCISTVVEAGIGTDDCKMEAGCYGFAMIGCEIVLVRVITMYSKGGGKELTPGFRLARASAVSHISQFRHINILIVDNSRLHTVVMQPWEPCVRLPTGADTVKMFWDHVEIKVGAHKIFDELMMEKEVLAQAVTSLNTVRCKGKANLNLLGVN